MQIKLSTVATIIAIFGFAGCERQRPHQDGSRLDVKNDSSLPERRSIPGRIWFIKTIGRTDIALPVTNTAIANWKPIAEIVDSLSFDAEGTPTWKLPLGWSQTSIVDNRSFELVHESGSRIEITSSSVPDITRDDTIKTRMDIWRDELGLPSLNETADWTNAFQTGVNPTRRNPASSRVTMADRVAQNITANPCAYRGSDQLRIERKNGGCSLGDAPVFTCSAPENKTGEASLWPFCSSQQMPCCRKCSWKPTSEQQAPLEVHA